MIIAGIDPGMTGALAVLFPDNSTIIDRVPLMKKGKVEPAWGTWESAWRATLIMAEPDLIVMEQVAARPGQGAASVFNFGRSYGFAHAIASKVAVPLYFVTPAVWKRKLGLLGADKNASREEARRLFPTLAAQIARVKDDGVAEAALLAYYGRVFL